MTNLSGWVKGVSIADEDLMPRLPYWQPLLKDMVLMIRIHPLPNMGSKCRTPPCVGREEKRRPDRGSKPGLDPNLEGCVAASSLPSRNHHLQHLEGRNGTGVVSVSPRSRPRQ